MRLSESQLTTNFLTKCSKMSEDHRLHGNNTKEDCQKLNCGQGGRLKFFKDGKFILELERALEGEKFSWVSVHQKTYWPPQGTGSSAPPCRQESITSLSVSDDNSSIQSSPWQRDHSWKQTCPIRNISAEMNLFFWRPKSKRSGKNSRKGRYLYSSTVDFENIDSHCNQIYKKFKKNYGKQSLMTIVQTLIDKNFQSSTPTRTESVVSPRKRFLREMEKDKVLVDDGCQKRSRNKTSTSNSSYSSFSSIRKSVLTNGIEDNIRPAVGNCSYSITSLLNEDRILKKSPNTSPSHCSPVSQPLYCSPPPEDRWYSESVDRLRSIELTQAEKCSLPSYHPHQGFASSYMYPFQPVPSYYSSNLYGRGYLIPSMYRGSPMPLAVQAETPPQSWIVEENPQLIRDNMGDKPLNLSKHPG